VFIGKSILSPVNEIRRPTMLDEVMPLHEQHEREVELLMSLDDGDEVPRIVLSCSLKVRDIVVRSQ
jgi:hypothetical protein